MLKKRIFKWFLRTIGVAGVVVAILLLVYINYLPRLAERKIIAALEAMGVDRATVQVRSITTGHLQVTNLALGDDAGLHIGAVGVDYSASLTGSIRITTIDLTGARLKINLRDGKLDIGPLAKLKSESGGEPGELPFDRVILSSASIVIEDPRGHEAIVPIDAVIAHHGAGRCSIEAKIHVMGIGVPVRGEVTIGKGVDVNLTISPLDQPITLVGRVGGEGEPTKFALATSLEQSPQDRRLRADIDFTRDSAGNSAIVAHLKADLAGERVQMGPVTVSADRGELRGKATLDLATLAAALDVSLAADRVQLGDEENALAIGGPAMSAKLGGELRDGVLTLKLAAPSTLAAKAFRLRSEQGIALDPMAITCEQADLVLPLWEHQPARVVPAGAEPHRPVGTVLPSASIRIATSPIKARGKTWSAGLAKLELAAAAQVDNAGQTTLSGHVQLDDGEVALPEAKTRIAGVAFRLPIGLGVEPPGKATLGVRDVQWNGNTFPAVTGSAMVRDGVLTADAAWPLFAQAPVRVEANLDLTSLSPAGSARVQMHELWITDPATLGKVISAAEKYQVTGVFDLDADLKLAGGTLTPDVRLRVRDATFTGKEKDISFTGIDAALTINSFAPLTTPPAQRVSIKKGHIGGLNLTNAVASLRLEAIDSLAVDLAGWSVGEKGRFWVHACRFNPAKPILETQLFIEDMSVAEWLTILAENKVKGEGFLYGRLPIRVDTTKEMPLSFGAGFLYAKPGGGFVQLGESAPLRTMVASTVADLLQQLQAEGQRRFLEALNDYQYDLLTFDFARENNKLNCLVKTAGTGRSGAKQQIGGLEVYIDDFGALLASRFIRNANAPAAIEDALKRLLPGE